MRAFHRRKLILLASALTFAGITQAQQQTDYSKVEIKTTKIGDNFYTLEGAGGTISALTGPDGIFLVDSQFAPLTDKLVAALKKISDKPVRYLVNTHVHGDHTGGNENFAKLGAIIFSREQLRERLAHPNPAADGTPGKPALEKALPIVTYDNTVTLHINGEEVRLIPVRKAHTDGDTLVHFSGHDALAVGDYFRTTGYPVVDLNNGGTLQGILDGLAVTIGRAGPNTKIIPGHGPITDRNGLIAARDLIIAGRDKIAPLVKQGKTLDEVLALKPTAEFDAKVEGANAQSAERFVRWLYTAIKEGK
ncbi:MAG TPA: MBL fold metallo-hydrolase [Cellvibrio sp.]|nr:MBL fold metallo-hydrolase [Cellvibrio sp.]